MLLVGPNFVDALGRDQTLGMPFLVGSNFSDPFDRNQTLVVPLVRISLHPVG